VESEVLAAAVLEVAVLLVFDAGGVVLLLDVLDVVVVVVVFVVWLAVPGDEQAPATNKARAKQHNSALFFIYCSRFP
jgi:hypothetical protein